MSMNRQLLYLMGTIKQQYGLIKLIYYIQKRPETVAQQCGIGMGAKELPKRSMWSDNEKVEESCELDEKALGVECEVVKKVECNTRHRGGLDISLAVHVMKT